MRYWHDAVSITNKIVSSNPAHGEVYSVQHYVIKFVSHLWQVGGFLRFFFTNKTDHHEITEILLKKALNTIIIPYYPWIPRLIFSITIIPFWASFNNNWIYYSFWSFTIKLWSPPTFSIINNIPTFSIINNLMYTGLSIKGGTRYFYLPKMVFGASWF